MRKVLRRDTGIGEMSETRGGQDGGGNRDSVLENKGQYCFKTWRAQDERPREKRLSRAMDLIQGSLMSEWWDQKAGRSKVLKTGVDHT